VGPPRRTTHCKLSITICHETGLHTLKETTKVIRMYGTSVSFYVTTRRNIPENSHRQELNGLTPSIRTSVEREVLWRFLDLFLCIKHVCQTLYKHAVRRMPCIKKLRRTAIIKDDTFIEIFFWL
jgi:hypothetical protein